MARLLREMRWVSTELEGTEAKRFKEYCRDMHLRFETSGVGKLTHFEVFADEEQIAKANAYLDTM